MKRTRTQSTVSVGSVYGSRRTRARHALMVQRHIRSGRIPRGTRIRVQTNNGLGFPRQIKTTLKYTETLKLTAASGVFTTYFFSANGAYDPNITGTGHQPMYFDQYAALYNHYTVIGSRITVRVLQDSATAVGCRVGLLQTDDSSYAGTADMDQIDEASMGRFRYMGVGLDHSINLGQRWSAKKTFGGSVLGNDNLQGSSSSNPTEQSYYMFCIQGLSGASTTPTLHCTFEIEYIMIWDELKDVTAS